MKGEQETKFQSDEQHVIKASGGKFWVNWGSTLTLYLRLYFDRMYKVVKISENFESTHGHTSYLSPPPPPAVVYFFQAGVPF